MIFGHNCLISEAIFKLFVALFRTHKLQKDDMGHIFLVVFQKSEISKNAVSERWCSDSSFRDNPRFRSSAFYVQLKISGKFRLPKAMIVMILQHVQNI